jgi:hypothetical protein
MGVVPVPEALRRLSQDPRFWSFLLVDDGTTADMSALGAPDELRISLPVAAHHGLVLDLDLACGEQTLGVRGPASSEPVQLGRAAPGRPHPSVLSFAEVELCARVIALDDPSLPHPGLVVALLSRFAPAGPDDDPAEVNAVLESAYRSLRRDVPGPGPKRAGPEADRTAGDGPEGDGPEQEPLPLFADAAWWPRPPAPSSRVLDEGTIAALLIPAPAGPDVRGDARFPIHDLTELVRQARARLARLPQEPWFDTDRVLPLARHITATGDLTPVGRLLGTLTEDGCDHPTVLDALSEPMVSVEACWMVETLAGAEPGTLLRRHLVGTARLG